jgi:hypothetical protein
VVLRWSSWFALNQIAFESFTPDLRFTRTVAGKPLPLEQGCLEQKEDFMKHLLLFVAGLIATSAFTFALAASTLALAGDYSNVWDNYQPQARYWENRGYSRVTEPADGELGSDETSTWYITLRAGYQYKFFGVCDGNCNDLDLDLELRDENGNTVDVDRQADDTPYVTVTPRYTQRYSFVVKMYD